MCHAADIKERAFEGARVETSVTGKFSFMNHDNKKLKDYILLVCVLNSPILLGRFTTK